MFGDDLEEFVIENRGAIIIALLILCGVSLGYFLALLERQINDATKIFIFSNEKKPAVDPPTPVTIDIMAEHVAAMVEGDLNG